MNTQVMKFAATPFMGWIIRKVMIRTDPLWIRTTRGRLSSGTFTGYPLLLLTTCGAQTGKRRSVPLLYLRRFNQIIVVACTTRLQTHPGWYHNLRKNPTVRVIGRGITGTYTATEATGTEGEILWETLTSYYPGYRYYSASVTKRHIPIIVLTLQNTPHQSST